jgi:hypothetical protein
MLKINYMSTLFVGIDVSSKSNVVCAIDFYKNQLIKSTVNNNQPGAYNLICQIVDVFQKYTDLNTVVIALESTSIYSLHIADFARVGRIETEPWRGSQFLTLQRLTRHRLHLVEALTREKTYMVSNIFLKFSELSILPKEERPFCDNYGATASSLLTEFLSMEDIINASPEELILFLGEKSKNRIENLSATTSLLQKASRDSYRLDKCLYEPLNLSL